MTRSIPDYESPESLVANENVCTEAKNEIVDAKISRGGYSPCQIVGGCCIVEDIGWTTNPERGVLSEWLVAPDTSGIEPRQQLPVGIITGVPRI